MENFEQRSCRFCLNSIDDKHFKLVESTSIQALDILVKRRHDINEQNDQVICNICSEKLHAAHDFKLACLCTEDRLCRYIDSEMETSDLREVYVAENKTNLSDEEMICRLCMQAIKEYIAIGKLEADMFQEYIPEVNLSISKDPVICKSCLSNLVNHNSFLKSFHVKKKMNNIEKNDIDNKAYISHMSLHIKSEIQDGNVDTKIDIRETESSEHTENKNNEAPFIKSEEIEIKCDNENIEQDSFQQDLHETSLVKAVEEAATENVFSVEKQNSQRKEEIKLTKNRWFKCNVCDYISRYGHLRRHMVTHKDISDTQWHQCTSCSFKCRRKDNLRKHALIHRDPSEIKWFECNVCDYKAKWHDALKRHMLIHKDPSEIDWLKCDKCDSKFKSKEYLIKHKLVHRDVSDIKWY